VFGQIAWTDRPNTVYTMGLGLNVSHDGGKTFRRIQTPGGDHHGLWIDPDNPRYLVNVYDQGFAISYDRGTTWKDSRLTLRSRSSSTSRTTWTRRSACTDRCRTTGASAAPWTSAAAAIGSCRWTLRARRGRRIDHAIDPFDPNIVYSSGFYGTLSRSDLSKLRGNPLRSKDLLPERYPDEPRFRGEWLAPTIISPHTNQILITGCSTS